MRKMKSHCFLFSSFILYIQLIHSFHIYAIFAYEVFLFFSSFIIEASDCLVVIVCLLILVVHQVFAKPIDNQNYRSNMASDSHSLQDKLRSPCREDRIPAQEDHNQANIKGILKVIKTQSAIAKSIARQDVAQYVSRILKTISFFCLCANQFKC